MRLPLDLYAFVYRGMLAEEAVQQLPASALASFRKDPTSGLEAFRKSLAEALSASLAGHPAQDAGFVTVLDGQTLSEDGLTPVGGK